MIKFNSLAGTIQQFHEIKDLSDADKMNLFAWLLEELDIQSKIIEGLSFKEAFKEKAEEVFK